MKKILLNKGLIIACGVVIVLLLGFVLYNTYATNSGVSLNGNDNTYDILLTESSNTTTVPAKSSKIVYYQFGNTTKGTLKYHVGYTANNVIPKVYFDTDDDVSGTIEYGEYKFIKLKLVNNTDENGTITIKPVLGYANGGEVIPDANTTLITDTINEVNTMTVSPSSALSSLGIDKANVKEIYFVDDNVPFTSSLGNVNMNDTGSIKLWYTNSDTNGLYKVYIGSDNGITSFPSDSSSVFAGFSNAEIIHLVNIDTTNITSVTNMFSGCSSLNSLDLSNFNINNITSLEGLFANCSSLTSIDLKKFVSNNVLNINNMFSGCTSLINIDISNLDFSNVTNYNDFIQNVPTNASIYLKDTQGNRDFISNNFSGYTNIQYIFN